MDEDESSSNEESVGSAKDDLVKHPFERQVWFDPFILEFTACWKDECDLGTLQSY